MMKVFAVGNDVPDAHRERGTDGVHPFAGTTPFVPWMSQHQTRAVGIEASSVTTSSSRKPPGHTLYAAEPGAGVNCCETESPLEATGRQLVSAITLPPAR